MNSKSVYYPLIAVNTAVEIISALLKPSYKTVKNYPLQQSKPFMHDLRRVPTEPLFPLVPLQERLRTSKLATRKPDSDYGFNRIGG